MKDGERWRTEVERRNAAGEERAYRYSSRDHWLEPFLEIQSLPGEGDMRDLFEETLYDFVTTVFPVEGERAWTGEPLIPTMYARSRHQSLDVTVRANPAARDKLVELLRVVRAAFRSTYAVGAKHGNSVMLKVAAGEMTLDEMNERVARSVTVAREAREELLGDA